MPADSCTFLSREASADALAAALGEAEVLIASPGDVHAVEPACPKLRFVQLTSCDYEQAVLAHLQSRALAVAGLGAALADDVAAVAVGLMLAVRSGLRAPVKAGSDAWEPLLRELDGKVIGIIGLGRAGTAVARLLRPHGPHLLYCDVRTPPQAIAREPGIRRVTQDRLLVESDFVTAHLPVTDQSKGGIGRREFGLLGPGSTLINTSAPGIIDRQVLISTLRAGRLEGFGTIDLDPGLASFANVVIADPKLLRTPGIATKAAAWIKGNVDAALDGTTPRGLVETIGYPRAGDPAFWSSRMIPREDER